MSNRIRDNGGRFAAKVTDQDILKAFDFEESDEDPFLTAKEVRNALALHWDIQVTVEGVRNHLETMVEDDQLARREFSRNSVAYRALVGPRLSEEIRRRSDEVDGELERGETTSLDDLKDELGME